jgi:PAS domain S-box-containing protein
MNPPSTTPDEVLAAVATEPLDALLRQIVNGYFVLTDGNGAVSKWSEPAELLFGRTAEEILGQSFFATLVGGELPPAGHAWRGFLDAGEPPRVPGTVQLTGRRTDGTEFPMEAVFVPVKLDEGFDFSLFLEDLSFDLPLNLMLMRMRQQHPVVVRALRGGIEPDAQPWDGGRTAGTFVVFKPLQPTPWVEAELTRREAERAAADAEAEERLTNLDPGIQGSVNDLDDAAAVVARLLSALERIDDLERVAGGLPAQLEEARREGDQRAEALRGDVQRALSAVPSQLDTTEQLARLERLERAKLDAEEAAAEQRRALAGAESVTAKLATRLDALERGGVSDARLSEAIAAAESKFSAAVAAARAAVEARVASLEGPDVGDQIERVRAEHEEATAAARAELAEAVERLARERAGEREADRAELAAALQLVERVQRDAEGVREQLAAVTVERATAQGLAGDDRRRLDELAAEADALRARVESIRADRDAELEALRASLAELSRPQAADEAVERLADELRSAVGRHDAALQELAELVELPAQITEFRVATAAQIAELRDLAARHEATAAEVAAMRDGADAAELREAVARHDAATEELRTALAELRDAGAEQREAADRRAEEAAARHDALAAELSELRDAAARHDDAVAELRDASAGEVAGLREAADRHDAALDELRRAMAELGSAPAPAEPDALPRGEVETLVGDAQQQLAALRAQVSEDIAALHARVDGFAGLAGRDELDALRERLEGLAARDELAAFAPREDLDGLAARLDGLPAREALDSLSGRLDDLAGRNDALTDRLETLAARDAVDALASRVETLPGREELDSVRARLETLAGRDEIDSLDARLETLAGIEAVESLAARVDELGAGSGRELAEEAIRRIEAVDRGAGTVLSDVRALRERVEESLSIARTAQETGRAEDEELRELIARLGGELEVARGVLERAESEALGARQAASSADQAAAAARADAATAREEASAARRELERVTLLEEEVARLAEGLSGARETAAGARAEAAGMAERLAAAGEQAEALRAELGTGRDRLNALDAQVTRLGETVGDAEDARRAADERAAALRSEISSVRDVAEAADAGLRALRDELARVREEALSVRTEFAAVREAAEAARADARRGDERVEAMQSELAYALASLEELKQGLSSAGQAAVIARREAEQARKAAQHAGDGSTERVTEVFQQILGMAAARGAGPNRRPPVPPTPKKPEPVRREPRHGFDDAAAPMATLGLDGKFKELNPAFAKLVGYQEHEFSKAAWPSPHDRRDYKDQLEQLTKLAKGELREVELQSTYMHGQGLMVPVIGKLAAVAGEDGLPSHLVLTAEDRHHT